FPPPWSAEVTPNCFIVRDASGQQIAYVYYECEPGRQSAAKLLSKDEARRMRPTSPSCRTPTLYWLIAQPIRRYLSLDVWPSRQARNGAPGCSRSSALLNLRRGFFGGSVTRGIASLISSTPCRRMRLRLAIRDQFARTITPPPSTSAKPPVSRKSG